jgi:hypothetical protein
MDLSYQSLKTEDYGKEVLMISGNVRQKRRKLCLSTILSMTLITSTVTGFENSRLLLESDGYTPDIFHDKY